MYSFKFAFQAVFLAATFVTVVLASPVNVHIIKRQNSSNATILTNAFISANAAVKTITSDIQNFSSPAKISATLVDFAIAATGVNMMPILMNTIEKLDDNDSQQVVNGTVVPLFVSLNETAHTLIQQATTITSGMDSVDLSSFKASIKNMASGITTLEVATFSSFSLDAVQQLDPISTEVNNAFETVNGIYNIS